MADNRFKGFLYYEELHNNRFPKYKISIIDKISNYLYFETEFGLCKKSTGNFGKTNYNILSAVDKTDYLKRQLFKKYGEIYDYSLVKWQNTLKDKIIFICKIHNLEFSKQINCVLTDSLNCPICGKEKYIKSQTSTTQEFIEKAKEIHGEKYGYSKVEYTGAFNKIEIVCKEHKEFYQTPQHHLEGHGCRKCSNINISKERAKNPTGWSFTGWIEASKKSKSFDSFKVYIIRCWNENEEFFKIGRTYRKVEKRFGGKFILPYNYEIIKIFEGNAEYILNLEIELKQQNKMNKYMPLLNFSGKHECFSEIINKK